MEPLIYFTPNYTNSIIEQRNDRKYKIFVPLKIKPVIYNDADPSLYAKMQMRKQKTKSI